MIRTRQTIEEALEARLQPPQIPPAERVWATARTRMGTTKSVRPRRICLQIALGVAGLFVLGIGITFAGSPDLREYVSGRGNWTGGRMQDGRLASLYPPPTFAVLQPRVLPSGVHLVGWAWEPGPLTVWFIDLPRPDGVMLYARIEGEDIPHAVLDALDRRGRELLDTTPGPMLVLLYAAGPDETMELVQQPAGRSHSREGDPLVSGWPRVLSHTGGRTRFAWLEQGTRLDLYSTLPEAETIRLAESVEVTPLAPFALPEPPSASERLRRETPLAERIISVLHPEVSHEMIAQACGDWNAGADTREGSRQAFCVARLAAGVAEVRGGWGTSKPRWREAAARLGVDASLGPSADTSVWTVQFEISDEEGGYMVVVDAASGNPIVVVRLKPDPARGG